MARVVEHAGFHGYLAYAVHDFLDGTLMPLIYADAVRYAPKRTGKMAGTIRWYTEGDVAYLSVDTPGLWVEMGHRVYHPTRHQVGPQWVPEEPFLRPALYKYRTPQIPVPPATFPVAVEHPGVTYRTVGEFLRARFPFRRSLRRHRQP